MTISEILRLPLSDGERAKYNANSQGKRISEVLIDGNKITGYGAFSFLWEKSYHKQPERSAGGVIGNLNSHTTFITPHLKIDFSLLSIDSYRKIMQLIYSKNEFVVQCYDIVYDKITTNKMYFATEEMPKIYSITRELQGQEDACIELLGVQDYVVEMIGTNVQVSGTTLTYFANLPDDVPFGTVPNITLDVSVGQIVLIGDGAEDITTSTPLGNFNYVFNSWNTKKDGTGIKYLNGDEISVMEGTVLYAIWETDHSYTLSYDYGVGEPVIEEVKDENGNTINVRSLTNKQIRYGEEIGKLPNSELPTVIFNGKEYHPYVENGWYWTNRITENSTKIGSDTVYGVLGNSTIYQIFDAISYTLTFEGVNNIVPSITAPYGSTIATVSPNVGGYKFAGWYYDRNYQKPFDNKMPPVDAVLYAKFTEE